ncbi:hypothetical protein BKA56DRAFT_720795, partial [Ilyonectria sp. MPI-CAGE-AT-0026]
QSQEPSPPTAGIARGVCSRLRTAPGPPITGCCYSVTSTSSSTRSCFPSTPRYCAFAPLCPKTSPWNITVQSPSRAVAQLSPVVDRRALRHHYNMCCIENMAAEIPLSEQPLVSEADATSPALGATSSLDLDSSTHLPINSSAQGSSNIGKQQESKYGPGDPTKRSRPRKIKIKMLRSLSWYLPTTFPQPTVRLRQALVGVRLVHLIRRMWLQENERGMYVC